MTGCSPVALFAFNRPDHTGKTLDALRSNDLAAQTEVTIFCDGPRSDDDDEAVNAVRKVAHAASGFKHVTVIERPQNLGLAGSVIRGVTEMLNDNETVIVIEDDLVTAPFFLAYMNEGLICYADEDRVLSICAYTHPTEKQLPDVFFLPGAHCWGWATWRRGWALFEHDPHRCLSELDRRNLIYEFDVNGAAPYTQFLQRTANGEGDSWALRWMASAILNGKLSLYPGTSLVQNIGNEGSGTNASQQDVFETNLATRKPDVGVGAIAVNPQAFAEFYAFLLRSYSQSSREHRLYYWASKLLPSRLERRLYSIFVRRSLGPSRHT